MKKYLLFLLIFFLLLFVGEVNAFSMWSVESISIRPKTAYVGEEISVQFELKGSVFSPGEASPTVKFDDGETENGIFCKQPKVDLDSIPVRCKYEFSHKYEEEGEYEISVFYGSSGFDNASLGKVTVLALPEPPPKMEDLNPLVATSIPALIELSSGMLYYVATGIVVLFVLIGGFTILTASGNPLKVSKGRNIIFYALMGFVLATLAKGIVELVKAILGIKNI